MIAWLQKLISPAPSFTDFPDHIRTAGFRFIGMPHLWKSYLGGSVSQIAKRRKHIEDRRLKAAQIKDDDLRECVMSYLDYYESKLPEEERELTERVSAKQLDAYRARTQANAAKADELLASEQNI